MRPTPWLHAEPFRIHPPGYRSRAGDDYGSFSIRSPVSGQELRCMANAGNEFSEGWEHVSVSLINRCPNWLEMSYIKGVFWLPHETVIQFHVPEIDHVNLHPHCLHLWRKPGTEFPRPPEILVGPAVHAAFDLNVPPAKVRG
jgi:hypothetical protein